eukprot:evm.model.scf_858.8 EVM.evm.TU.scf_858.8   scf_858:46417-49795(+)
MATDNALVDRWFVLLLIVVWVHVGIAPFTKVEESFNMQAVHDLLFHGTQLDQYDHKDFPGVVPRTFWGSLVVGCCSAPWVWGLSACGLTKLSGLYVVRGVVGLMLVLSLCRLRQSVSSMFGQMVGTAFILITSTQFHLPFYMSRLLPNTLALGLTNLALADMIEGKHLERVVALLVFTVTVVRCDVVLLLPPVGLQILASSWPPTLPVIRKLVAVGLASALLSIACTVLVDSWFWGRWLWPEGQVLWFNTILNNWKVYGWRILGPRTSLT